MNMGQLNWFVGIFLACCLVFLGSLYLKYAKSSGSKGCKANKSNAADNGTKVAVTSSTVSDVSSPDRFDIHKLEETLRLDEDNKALIEQAFHVSLQLLMKIPKDIKVSTETQLKLYGLFKQANVGDINTDEPSRLYYAEHAKWCAWNEQKGKDGYDAKREYFYVVYDDIAKPSNLNILLFNANAGQEMPQDSQQTAPVQRASGGFNMAVNSKIAEEFDEELHGDPNELFNKFDLTEEEIDLEEIKQYIENNKININKQNENGTTFLNFAVDNNKYDLSKMLIQDFAANVNLCDDMGYSALHCAAMNGDEQIIVLLLEHGADVHAKSMDDEETPADLAEDEDIKQMLTA